MAYRLRVPEDAYLFPAWSRITPALPAGMSALIMATVIATHSAFPLPRSSIQELHSVHSLPSIPQRSLLGIRAPSIETACQLIQCTTSLYSGNAGSHLSERGHRCNR
ncbi:unnamed protein product [Lota lota]